MLASSYVRDVIRSLLDKVDYVVVDTAPLLPVADGSEVAALADGTLLVARHGLTTDTHVKRAVHDPRRVDAKLLGVVLNRVPSKRNKRLRLHVLPHVIPRGTRVAARRQIRTRCAKASSSSRLLQSRSSAPPVVASPLAWRYVP